MTHLLVSVVFSSFAGVMAGLLFAYAVLLPKPQKLVVKFDSKPVVKIEETEDGTFGGYVKDEVSGEWRLVGRQPDFNDWDVSTLVACYNTAKLNSETATR